MAPTTRRQIEEAHRRSAPILKTSGKVSSLVLPIEGSRLGATLMRNGVLTGPGKLYEQITGTKLVHDHGFRGKPYTTATQERIMTHKGTWVKLGTMKDGVYTPTATGLRYYKEHPTSYTVQVPVKVLGRNSKGDQYERETHFPVNVDVDLHESDPNFVTKLKDLALAVKGPEWNMSSESWQANPSGPWEYSKMTVSDGHAVASVDIPLRGDSNCHSFLAHPSCLGDEAFGVGECVPTQLSKRMGLSHQQLVWEFTEIARELYAEGQPPFFDEWSVELGVTSRMVEALCRKYHWNCHAVFDHQLASRYMVQEQAARGSLVYSFHQGHFFLYDKNTTATHSIPKWAPPKPLRPIMRSIQQYSKRPDVDTWLPYEDQGDADPLPGSWYIKKPDPRCPEPALSFKQARLNLIATKRSPAVFKAGGRLNLMVFKSRVPGVENTYIMSVPYYFDELKAVAKVLNVPYLGTNVGSYALSAIVHHLREPRVAVSSSEREQLLRDQHFSCNLCEKTLDRTKVEVDHIHPVHCSLTDAKLQVLCVECHAKKTGEQGRHDISITSHLSDELWGVFEENPVALAVVLRVGDPGKREAHYVDTIRCRTEILKGSSHDWPIFLPHDRVEAVEPGSLELGDFCYVAHKCPETVLEGGQRTLDSNWDADKIVQSLPLRGPGWYHRCAVEAALEFGVIGWDSVTQRITASARVPKERFGEAARRVLDALPPHLQKEAANHAIGLMVPKSLAKYRVLSSSNPEDAMTLDGVVHAATVHGTNVVDYTVEQPVLTRQTQKPLYLKIIHEEATQLARRMRSLRCTRIYELNTDSILYEGEPPMLDPRIRYKRTREERLKGDWKLPVLNHPAPKPPVFVDLDEAQALEHLLNGGSLYLEGLAGTGKSYFLRRAREALQAQGKEVRCVAKTYVGAANIGGETLDRFTHSFGGGKKTRVDVLIVDEISLVDAYLWTYVASMRTVIPQIVLAGDWEQLPPPANEYLGFAVRSMRGAPMLAQLGARLVLRECRRSDAALYSLYHGLIGSPRPIAEDVAAMKAALPNIPGHCKINLVQRHCHRIQLNERLQHYYAPKDAVLLKKSEVQIGPSESQDILLYPGLQLLSVVNTKGLRNMWTYTVDSVGEHVCLHDDRGAYKVHASMITELFRPAFARTYFAAQGLTFERVRLWGYTSPFYTHAHLITGLSRCTTAAGVDFGLY